MTELIPELDKLRNKELSFWCIYRILWYDETIDRSGVIFKQTRDEWIWKTIDDGWDVRDAWFIEWREREQIIWHPLTAWRIWKLWYDSFAITGSNIIHTMQCIMIDIQAMWLADKTEVERQRHQKRPELKELLIQFSNYL